MYCWERSKLSIDSSQSIPMSMGQCSEPQLANAPMGMRASATRIENARQNMELLLVGADGIAVSARTGRDPWRQAGKRDALGARRRIGGYGIPGGKSVRGEWVSPGRVSNIH